MNISDTNLAFNLGNTSQEIFYGFENYRFTSSLWEQSNSIWEKPEVDYYKPATI